MGSNPTRVALFSFYVKKELLGLVAKRFFHACAFLSFKVGSNTNFAGYLFNEASTTSVVLQ